MKKKGRMIIKSIKYILLLGIPVYLALCFILRLEERQCSLDGECRVYYMVNTDGMKGLGHSILVLSDAGGNGTAISFNGMQTTLGQALLGAGGVGKLTQDSMGPAVLNEFLRTGNLSLEGDQLSDNYDWAVYRNITEDAYREILENTEVYIEAGNAYAILNEQYMAEQDPGVRAIYGEQLDKMGEDSSLPLYYLYHNNCDDVARILAASVDSGLDDYNQNHRHMTPNGNLKAFARMEGRWGVKELGDNSFWEKAAGFLMIF